MELDKKFHLISKRKGKLIQITHSSLNEMVDIIFEDVTDGEFRLSTDDSKNTDIINVIEMEFEVFEVYGEHEEVEFAAAAKKYNIEELVKVPNPLDMLTQE